MNLKTLNESFDVYYVHSSFNEESYIPIKVCDKLRTQSSGQSQYSIKDFWRIIPKVDDEGRSIDLDHSFSAGRAFTDFETDANYADERLTSILIEVYGVTDIMS